MGCIPMTNFVAKIFTCSVFITIITIVVTAQEITTISADKVERFQSVQQIDYADFDIDINVGWFVANPSASELVVFDNHKTLHKIIDGEIVDSWQYVTDSEQIFSVIDGEYVGDNFYILYTIDNMFWINETPLLIDGIPMEMGRDDDYFYIEAQLDNDLMLYALDESINVVAEMTIPADFDEPVMRIGRIDFPIVVQTTLTGDVTIYNFDTLLGEYKVGDVPTVFGHVNAPKTHFAWVDPESTLLNLLDLATGENRVVAELDNLYAQYYLLSQDASLVIAVNVDFEPNLVAWDTDTGERYELGEYRDCERIPDKAKLSADGSTLIIGCDGGIELWRIVDETEMD